MDIKELFQKKETKYIFLILSLVLLFLLVYLPHFSNPFPFHIDEWRHITEALDLKNNFFNPKTINLEIGFHYILAILSFFGNLVLMYKFFPAIWALISALALFFLVYKKTNSFYTGLLSIIFFASLKSNTNILGLWFFTPLTFAIPFIFLYFYFFTEGIERQSKKHILASLTIMAFLIPIHAPSVLFSIPILIVYSAFHKKYVKKEWRFFSLFLIIPLIGVIFYSLSQGLDLSMAIKDLIHSLQFHKGWGVLEINNSPFELYSPVGYFLASIGMISIIVFSKKEKLRKLSPFMIWPLVTVASILIFRETGISYLVPYQRNLYYLAISLPILSSIGLSYIVRITTQIIKTFEKKGKKYKYTKIIVISIITLLTVSLVFAYYLNIPKNLKLYQPINQNDYGALQYLESQPKGKVIAPIKKSVAVKPIANKEPLASVYFYNKEKRGKVKRFFESNKCKTKRKIIKDNKIRYILSNKKIGCKFQLIYDKKPFIYKTS